jgi:CubicO group peptidase (beta-lactamase class C family)
MLHLSGFPSAPLGPPAWSTKAGRLEAFGKWRLQWEPGTKYEYHPTSAHWVLAELIDRVTGADYRDVIAERITTPIGLPRVLGITEPVPVRVPHSVGGFPTPDELEEVFGVRELGVTEVTSDAMTYLAHPDAIAVGLPGGGGIMRAADLVVFYQELLHNTHGIWDPAVLDDAKTNVRNMLPDALTGVPASRTLGLVTAGADGRGSFRSFGKTNSAGAFGHSGAFGLVAWADPETGLSFAYLTDGLDEHVIRQAKRGIALSSLANLCVQ